jgi:hypothetical protein
MKITKRHLRRIIKEELIIEKTEFAPTAEEEAKKINAQTGAGYVTDQAFWAERGIVTGEDLALSVLDQTYSDLYKDIHGFRPRGASLQSVEDYTAAINDLDEYYASMMEEEQIDIERQQKIEKERQELADLMPGAFDFQDLPKQSGMGRRLERKKIIGKQSLVEALKLTPEEITDGLATRARGYHQDAALEDPNAIKMLLQDDFMDDFGHQADIKDYEDLIDQLSLDPNVTIAEGRKKIRIVKKQLQKLISEIHIENAALTKLSKTGGTVVSVGVRSLYKFLHETSSWNQQRVLEAIFARRQRSNTSVSLVFEDTATIESVIFEADEAKVSDFAEEMITQATEDVEVEVPTKNFVIMVGGPGTGKGGVINTDKFMGSTVDATKGVMAAQDYLRSEEGKDFGAQIADEVDGYLRIEQRAHADEVHAKLNQGADGGDEAFQSVLDQLVVTDNTSVDLRSAIGKALGKDDWKIITADDWKSSELSKSVDAMVGPSSGVDSLKDVGGGDDGIKTQFMLLRSKWGEAASAMTLKSVAVQRHGEDLKQKITDFIENDVEGGTEEAGSDLPATRKKKGVYILDSAGEDLPSQDYEGQLRTAKSLGFKTYIVWLNTGPEVSYVGNLERSVAGGKRAVPADEIEAYYTAAEGGMEGGSSARDYFTSLTTQSYAPSEDDNPHAVSLGEVPLLDKVLVLNQKDELEAAEVSDIASKTCVNPAGFQGKDPGDPADPENNIDNPLCSSDTASSISGMDISIDAEAGSGAPKNYNELVKSLEDELMDQVVAAIEGQEVEIPSSVKSAMGAGFKDAIKKVSKEYSKEDLKTMSDEDLQQAVSDLDVDIDELAKEVISQVKNTRQSAIRDLIKKGKGSSFETEEISAEIALNRGNIITERWQKLAGIIRD